MAMKIKMDGTGDDKRVPPEVMDLLLRLAQHRDLCDECGPAFKAHATPDRYCATGRQILAELWQHPSVSYEPD